jgi:hypothetical protein
VDSAIRSRPLMALDAVVTDTPAREATSVRVAGRAEYTGKAYATDAGRYFQLGNRFRVPELPIYVTYGVKYDGRALTTRSP